jgi:gliding motility-associated protein GldC
MSKKGEIKINLELDENNVPDKLSWEASDAKQVGDCQAVIISIWDKKEQNTLKIDLWDKEFNTDQMKQFVHQNLMTLSETLERATGEHEMGGEMREFAQYFKDRMGL